LGNGLSRENVLLGVQLEEELGDELALLLLPFDGFGDSLEEEEEEEEGAEEPREQQTNAYGRRRG
jgi:NTP pyrophosphatase (non-canonical NTP hydrolase)